MFSSEKCTWEPQESQISSSFAHQVNSEIFRNVYQMLKRKILQVVYEVYLIVFLMKLFRGIVYQFKSSSRQQEQKGTTCYLIKKTKLLLYHHHHHHHHDDNDHHVSFLRQSCLISLASGTHLVDCKAELQVASLLLEYLWIVGTHHYFWQKTTLKHLFKYFQFMYMSILHAYIFVYHMFTVKARYSGT